MPKRHPKSWPGTLVDALVANLVGRRRATKVFRGNLLQLPLGIERLQSQAVIRRFLSKLGTNSGEELDPFEGNAQHIVSAQIESMAAFQSSADGEEDDLRGRRAFIALELRQQAATVQRADIRLQQNQIRLQLKDCPDIRSFGCGNLIAGARQLRHKASAQILGHTQQENLRHALFSH